MESILNSEVPILDLTNQDLKPNSTTWHSVSKEVCEALEKYGCFIAVNGGETLQLEALTAAQELFGLPKETKKKNVIEKPYHGYTDHMHGFSLREGLGIESSMDNEEAQRFTHLMWPQGNDRFCETVHTYSNAVVKLDQLLVRMIFENYGMEKHYDSHIKSVSYLLRFLKYLPPPESIPTLVLPQHTDSTFLSILHYNDVNGLEVKLKNNEWITMHLPPKSYFVLAGDIAKAWSNDRIRSCEHRVTMAGDKIRYTLAVFSYVKGTISVPEELVDDEHPLLYKPFDNLALIKFNATKEGREAKSSLKAFCGI